MKRWLQGLMVFVAALFLGYGITHLSSLGFFAPPSAVDSEIDPIPIAAERSSLTQTEPEFKDVEIPEEFEVGEYREFLPVFGGSASLGKCELSAEDKGRWIGLYKHGNRYSLDTTVVNFGAAETNDFGTYHEMHFPNAKNAVFLINESSGLKPGAVTTVYVAPKSQDGLSDDLLETGNFRREFSLNGRSYVMRVASGTSETGQLVNVLVLEGQGRQDIIYYTPEFMGLFGSIEWVGDLDNDGRLDLHFSYFRQNGGTSSDILFLSSFAKKGHLVQPFAFFNSRFTGC